MGEILTETGAVKDTKCKSVKNPVTEGPCSALCHWLLRDFLSMVVRHEIHSNSIRISKIIVLTPDTYSKKYLDSLLQPSCGSGHATLIIAGGKSGSELCLIFHLVCDRLQCNKL